MIQLLQSLPGEMTTPIDETPSSPSSSLELAPALHHHFCPKNLDDMSPKDAVRESLWRTVFAEYGRGVCMYRTRKIREEISRGLPDSLRGEMWLVCSGAINEVNFISFTSDLLPLTFDLSHGLLLFLCHYHWTRTLSRLRVINSSDMQNIII